MSIKTAISLTDAELKTKLKYYKNQILNETNEIVLDMQREIIQKLKNEINRRGI